MIAADKLTSALPQLGLTLHLLEEALNEDSRWAAYIRALPDTYDTVLYFTPQEVEMLRGSPCFGECSPDDLGGPRPDSVRGEMVVRG